jgi:hypothetical protein
MLSVNVEVSVFDGSLEVSVVTICVFMADFLLGELQLVLIENWIRDGISEDLDCLVDIALEDL